MTLRAVERRTLPDEVFGQLAGEILSGRYPPGSTVPSERELSETLGVNRHAIREAVKRLEQIALVKVSQGGPTKVLDYRQTGGLDLLGVLATHGGASDGLAPVFGAILEMRAGIGTDVARLCAQRGDSTIKRDLVELSEQLARASRGPEQLALDERFWQRMLDGAGNLAYQLAFNSLMGATRTRPDISLPWLEQELERSDYRRPLAAAIEAGEPDAAACAARAALEPANAAPASRRPRARRARA